jgi:hypothetical protein
MAKHYPQQPVAPDVADPPCERCGGDPASCACYEERPKSRRWESTDDTISRLIKERDTLLAAIDAYFEAQKNRSVTAKEDDALRRAANLARSGEGA